MTPLADPPDANHSDDALASNLGPTREHPQP